MQPQLCKLGWTFLLESREEGKERVGRRREGGEEGRGWGGGETVGRRGEGGEEGGSQNHQQQYVLPPTSHQRRWVRQTICTGIVLKLFSLYLDLPVGHP